MGCRRSLSRVPAEKPGHTALTNHCFPHKVTAPGSKLISNSKTQPATAMNIIFPIFLVFILFFLVYYFLKARISSDVDSHVSVNLPKTVKVDRRQHPRTDVNWPVTMETPGGTVEARVNNISLNGAFVCCEKPLPVGEVFHLTMIVPDNEPIAATAQVVWSNVNVPDEKVVNRGMGVRFLQRSERHIQFVRQLFQESDESATGSNRRGSHLDGLLLTLSCGWPAVS